MVQNIIKEEVFELIRSEKAVLWAGAGLSLYAGYPSAQKIVELMQKRLPVDQQQLIATNSSLDDASEEFIKINNGNRKALLNVLKTLFSKKENSSKYHDMLAQIPHLRTIVTTNYDRLFETAFKDKIQVVAQSSDLRNIDKKTCQLFKIHGDLNHSKQIIITKTDYANFYNNSTENVYWITLKERMINNNIIFIGYSLGDINISTIINSITAQLGNNRHRHYLIAPNFPTHEIESLRKLNIAYIDSTGEQFIEELIQNIRLNIVKDHKSGKIGVDTLAAFLNNHSLTADFQSQKAGYLMTNIQPIDGKVKEGLLSINASGTFLQNFGDFIKGKTFGSFELGDSVTDFEMSLSGITLLSKEDIHSLTFVSKPSIETTFDIVFENNFELRNVPVSIYYSTYKVSLVVSFRNKKIEIEIFKNSVNPKITIEHSKPYGNPKDELEAFNFLNLLAGGMKFDVYVNDGKKYPGSIKMDNSLVESISKYVRYFEILIQIERFYNVRFKQIDVISDDNFNVMLMLLETIKGEELFFEFSTTLEGMIDRNDLSNFAVIHNGSPNEISVVYTDYLVHLYGQEILFKQRVWKLFEPEIVNWDDVQNGSTDRIVIISKSKKASDQYFLSVPQLHL